MRKRFQNIFLYTILIGTSLLLLPILTFSQRILIQTGKLKFEAGIALGPSFFLGDLGGNAGKGSSFIKDINLQFTNIMDGAYLVVYPADWIGFRLGAQVGKLQGDDSAVSTKGTFEVLRKQRNLDFKTNITEAYFAIEVFPLMLLSTFQRSQPKLRPYAVAGVGIFHFNPQGSLKDTSGHQVWYYLHPLRLEGQGMKEYPDRKEYKLTQINIPVGLGFKYFISERFNISGEFLFRKTFTDYVDDVSSKYIDPIYFDRYLSPADAALAKRLANKSLNMAPPDTQRGNSKNNDSYFNLFLKVGVHLGRIYSTESEKNNAHQSHCPSLY